MPKRILIAEDDDLQSAVLRSALHSRGYETEVVRDGLDAVRRLRSGQFDLALLDYHMPEIDGLGAARLLHDLLPEAERPRLIAITATAEGLQDKEEDASSFDAIVSKRVGLPALFSVIEANLAVMAERQVAVAMLRQREQMQLAAVASRRRWLAPLRALPALGMVGAFVAALGWATTSLHGVDAALLSTGQAGTFSSGTAALLDAMQDAENSQRSYLASGNEADRAQFGADTERVDRLLESQQSLSANGAPGFDPGASPQTVIEERLRVLSVEAEARAMLPSEPAASGGGRDAALRLRDWAGGLVGGALQTVSSGLGSVHRHIALVVGVLVAGLAYSLWNAVRLLRRLLRPAVRVVRAPPAFRPGPAPFAIGETARALAKPG